MEPLNATNPSRPTEPNEPSSWEGTQSVRRCRDSAGVEWHVLAGWEPAILGPAAPAFGNLEAEPRATLVKANPLRRVWRLTLDDSGLYVKEFLRSAGAGTFRRWWRGPDSMVEWRAGLTVAARGIPAVSFVACGVGRDRGYLVSQEVPGATVLSDAWQAANQISDPRARDLRKRALIAATARLLSTAHQARFLHGDEHPSNILIRPDDAEHLTALYVDIHRSGGQRPVGLRDAAVSLAQVRQWFLTRSTKRERLRFLRSYVRISGGDEVGSRRAALRPLCDAVGEAGKRHAQRLWTKRDRRMAGDNRYFARLNPDPFTVAQVVLRLRPCGDEDGLPPERTAADWMPILDELFANPDLRSYDLDRRLRETRNEPADTGPIPSPSASFSTSAGRWWVWYGVGGKVSPAQRLWTKVHVLRHRDIRCRPVLAAVERRPRDSAPFCAVLVSEAPVSDSPPAFLGASSAADRVHAVRSLSGLVGLMLERGMGLTRLGPEALGVVRRTRDVWIEDASAVGLCRAEAPDARVMTYRAVARWAQAINVYRPADAVRFLKRLHPNDWKNHWRRVVELDGHRPGEKHGDLGTH